MIYSYWEKCYIAKQNQIMIVRLKKLQGYQNWSVNINNEQKYQFQNVTLTQTSEKWIKF